MAIYHLNASKGSRAAGKSAYAKFSYVTRTGRYAGGSAEVLWSASGNVPAWAGDAAEFWRAADEHERANGRLFREYQVSLPRELGESAWRGLVRRFADEVCGDDRLPWTVAIHRGGGGNPHFHFVVNERCDDGVGRDAARWFGRAGRTGRDPASGGARKTQRLEKKPFLYGIRRAWAGMANSALASAALAERIDHRSLAAQRHDAEARGDHAAAAALDREPVHQSRSSMALDDADPDGRPGTVPRRRRRRRRPAGTDAGRRARAAKRRNAERRRDREELARQVVELSALAAGLKQEARNLEAEYGRRELARREEGERAEVAGIAVGPVDGAVLQRQRIRQDADRLGELKGRLAEQGKRFSQVQAWRRGELDRLSHCLFEAKWRRSREQLQKRLRLEALTERLERQEQDQVRRRQEELNRLAVRLERRHQQHLRFAQWRERTLAELRRAGRYRGPDGPSELHIVSHPAFVAPISRKAGPQVGVIDRSAMDNEPQGRVSGWLRSLARVTEPLFTPPSERTERVLMRAVEERREAGLSVGRGREETLVLVEEGWQAEAVAKAPEGFAVLTMDEVERDAGLLALAVSADALVLPFGEGHRPRLRLAVRQRGRDRPAQRTGDPAEAVHGHVNELQARKEAEERKAEADRRAALLRAAREGDPETVRAALESGVDIDARGRGKRTALHEAVLGGHPEVVKALIGAGADLDLRNDDGWTARDLAERHGQREAERLLEDASAARTQTPWDDPSPW
ncbi:MAG: MobA/MobL family protein [Rhodospirillaceae bacterium]|nr:MobA/MobL family protein [Rhodospirillaceae bacterium]